MSSVVRRLRARHARHGRGQTLVEFAFVLPIFLLILFGMIDMGRYVYLNSTLSQAAREAARRVSVEAYWVGSSDATCGAAGGPVCPATVAALRTDALTAANRMMTPFGAVASTDLYTSCDRTTAPSGIWTTQTCSSRAPGDLASVRVVSIFRPITPIIGQMFSSITTVASATMVIN
jgi:Flp pilus assembly protein TadG